MYVHESRTANKHPNCSIVTMIDFPYHIYSSAFWTQDVIFLSDWDGQTICISGHRFGSGCVNRCVRLPSPWYCFSFVFSLCSIAFESYCELYWSYIYIAYADSRGKDGEEKNNLEVLNTDHRRFSQPCFFISYFRIVFTNNVCDKISGIK